MRIVYIELVNSNGGVLNQRVVNIPDGEEGDHQIQAAMLEFVRGCILNPGDTIRISEYQ